MPEGVILKRTLKCACGIGVYVFDVLGTKRDQFGVRVCPPVLVSNGRRSRAGAWRRRDRGAGQQGGWSLPADVTGTLELNVNGNKYPMDITSNTNTMVAAVVDQDELLKIVGDMNKTSSMSVIAGDAAPVQVPLDGSNTVMNAFLTCANIQAPNQGGGESVSEFGRFRRLANSFDPLSISWADPRGIVMAVLLLASSFMMLFQVTTLNSMKK